MSSYISSFSLSCASCSKDLHFNYQACAWITCPHCGALIEKTNTQKTFSNQLPGDDASLIQPGTLGTWNKYQFEVTGRIRFIFADESYVNWWHLATSATSLWLAESYGSMRIMAEKNIAVKIGTLEIMNPGDKVKLVDADNFQLNSFSMALSCETEGELPFNPGEKKFMWLDLSGENLSGLDVHIFDRKIAKVYLGEDVDHKKISLTKIRKVNGWN